MDPSFIQSLRRSPRLAACCEVHVATSAGLFSATTEDVSAQGCRLVSPRAIRPGERVRLSLRHAGLTTHLRAAGRVAWCSRDEPWKVGVAFDAAAHQAGTRWFSQLLRFLGLPKPPWLPDLIPVSATVYLAAPPLVPVELRDEELAILLTIREGCAVSDLLGRFHEHRPAAERALFALLALRFVTFSRSDSVHPAVWRAFLTLQRERIPADAVRSTRTAAGHALPNVPSGAAVEGPIHRR